MSIQSNLFRQFILVIPLLTVLTARAQVKVPQNVGKAINTVQSEEIKADIKYLADDRLAGRFPGTPGYQIAVDYVIGRLKSLHVKPAGENGSWLQTVRLRNAVIQDARLSLNFGNSEQAVIPGKRSYLIYPNPAMPHVEVSSSLVFAGYGISEPSAGYDDYNGLDVKGKTVVILRGSPDNFSSSVAAHVTNSSTILKTAAEHGAVGVIIGIPDSTIIILPDVSRGIYSVLDKKDSVSISMTYYSKQISLFATARHDLLARFFAAAGKNLDATIKQLKAGTPQSFPVPVEINASFNSAYHDVTSYNVIGKIEGSDKKLKHEYVIHSAHLDHLGIGKPVEGDSIYNGAHDNASGVASLLGIAKIYKNVKVKPRRSVIVLFVTGEEMGLLGSGYFAKYPTVPIKNIVADVNTDMPTIIAPLLSITALGAEHSSLSKQVNEAAGYFGIEVEPDPEPKQARFTRSDQYSFVLAGIPALHIKYGNKTADGKNNLNELVAQWRAKYYHKPQDDINGVFDFEAGKKYAQLNFLIGYLVAQDKSRPAWNPGDLFELK
jgi:hypothetical protein